MKADLLRQLADYGAFHEEAQEQVGFEEIEGKAVESLKPVSSRRTLEGRPVVVRRGAAVAFATGLGVVLLIGVAAMLQRSNAPTDTQPPAATTATPSVTEVAPTAAPIPDEPAPTQPPATVAPTPSPAGFGDLAWRTRGSVPVDLLDQGFPRPGYTFDAEIQQVYAESPCCLEIYRTDAGYLGLRDSAADTKLFVIPDGGPELGVEGGWFAPYGKPHVYPTEIWFSVDGSDWDMMSGEAFGAGTAVIASDPFVAVEREGTWMVIGLAGAGTEDDQETVLRGVAGTVGGDLPRDAVPVVWVSDDLMTWSPVSDPFVADATRTRLTSIAASDRGWVVFGVRVSAEAPYVTEWVGWSSDDGRAWEALPVDEQLGDSSPCVDERPWRCSWLQGALTDDSVVVYAWTWDLPVFDWRQANWRLLIGNFPDEAL
jgi:hypothetical protein